MAGSVAVAAHSIDEALKQLEHAENEKVDLVKLMITGGVLDAKEKGVPGELKMKPEMVKAVCDRAHAAGYKVAAHVESPDGVKVALANGVDSIEHGAKPDDEMIRLFKEKNAFLCTTISPAVPYALLTGHSLMRRRLSSTMETSCLMGLSSAQRRRWRTIFRSFSETMSDVRG